MCQYLLFGVQAGCKKWFPAENKPLKVDKEKYPFLVTKILKNDNKKISAYLTPAQYDVTQFLEEWDPPESKFNHFYENGTYDCIIWDQKLFRSEDKVPKDLMDNLNWPQFKDVYLDVAYNETTSRHVKITTVHCPNWDSHVGEILNLPHYELKKRYLVNSAALCFTPYDISLPSIPGGEDDVMLKYHIH